MMGMAPKTRSSSLHDDAPGANAETSVKKDSGMKEEYETVMLKNLCGRLEAFVGRVGSRC